MRVSDPPVTVVTCDSLDINPYLGNCHKSVTRDVTDKPNCHKLSHKCHLYCHTFVTNTNHI